MTNEYFASVFVKVGKKKKKRNENFRECKVDIRNDRKFSICISRLLLLLYLLISNANYNYFTSVLFDKNHYRTIYNGFER